MRLPWWREIRVAEIPKTDRDIFESFGETVIALIVTGGLQPRSVELQRIYGDSGRVHNAEEWLTERGDIRERHEQRLEAVEWAILIFVVLDAVLMIIELVHHW